MKLLLGHNQFLGISHISDERSREREKKFSNVKNIYDLVEKAVDFGYKGMILETHPRMLEFLEYYKKNKTFDIDFYLQLPNIQSYIQKMNEQGLSALIFDIVRHGGLKTTTTTLLDDIINYIKKDYISIGLSFLKFEIEPFRDINIKALLLHNVITDLLLSLRVSTAFKEYCTYVEDSIEITPGFITLNFDLLRKSFEKWDIKTHLIMTPVNPGGYDMNPSKEVIEKDIRNYPNEVIAMNILGGGAFSPTDAYKYLKSFNKIEYCVVGASSNEHLKELIDIFGD